MGPRENKNTCLALIIILREDGEKLRKLTCIMDLKKIFSIIYKELPQINKKKTGK